MSTQGLLADPAPGAVARAAGPAAALDERDPGRAAWRMGGLRSMADGE